MRWKLLRRRFSISAPRVTVRRHLPWPLRWLTAAVVLGFSAAIALWAFQVGKDLAGLDRNAKEELSRLRDQQEDLKAERDKAQAIANTAESLLKTERVTEERLTAQLRQSEADKLALQADLGFFQQLIPQGGGTPDGLTVRGFQAEMQAPGHVRYQLLVVQGGRSAPQFNGHFELTLIGTLNGQPWISGSTGANQALQVKQYARVEGMLDCPPSAVVKSVQVKVTDAAGAVRALQTLKL
jgi:type II secretory pathway pseudopilin PulG